MPEIDWNALISQYGYLAVFLVTLGGGETIVLLAGFWAHQGDLLPQYIALAAFFGNLIWDQFLFFLARNKGTALLRRFPRIEARLENFSGRLGRSKVLLMLLFPFLYGLRNVTLIFLGLNRAEPKIFFPLNCLASAVWASMITAIGYYFGVAVEASVGGVHHYQFYVLGVVLLAGLAFWLIRRRRGK